MEKVAQLSAMSGNQKGKPRTSPHKAPKHLRAATRRWFEQICEDFVLESYHILVLTLACEAWDRHLDAREALEKHGSTTFVNPKTGDLKPRPEIAIERDSRNAFMRAVRELNLSEAPPEPPRPNRLKYGGR